MLVTSEKYQSIQSNFFFLCFFFSLYKKPKFLSLSIMYFSLECISAIIDADLYALTVVTLNVSLSKRLLIAHYAMEFLSLKHALIAIDGDSVIFALIHKCHFQM